MGAEILGVPVSVGQIVETTIAGYGHEGEGVGRYQGFTVFIPGAIRDELVRVEITEVRKNFARGKVVALLQSSTERVAAICPVYQDCGGCQLQHLSYPAQLRMKHQQVVDAVQRIGGLSDVVVHPILGMKEPWYYRNKIQYPFAVEGDTVVMGFYHQGTHRIVSAPECLLQTMVSNWIAAKVLELVKQHQVSIYHEATGAGLLQHVLIKRGFATHELMVVLVTSGADFPAGAKLAAELIQAFPAIKSVIQNINRLNGKGILEDKSKVLAGAEYISDLLGELKFKISARSFFQVNPVQAEVLYTKALQYAGLTGQETVVDAYCGVGSLTLFLARQAAKVYGIEVVPEAIADAKANAALNHIDNTEFLVGRTERILPELVNQGIRLDVAVVDPPRSGCEPLVLESIAHNEVPRIVYVSCNPGTLARDLKLLTELGYRTEEIQPVDMFPHTYHTECVAKIQRR